MRVPWPFIWMFITIGGRPGMVVLEVLVPLSVYDAPSLEKWVSMSTRISVTTCPLPPVQWICTWTPPETGVNWTGSQFCPGRFWFHASSGWAAHTCISVFMGLPLFSTMVRLTFHSPG